MTDIEIIQMVQQIERTLSQISTKGQDSFFMVACLNSLRQVRDELSKRLNDGEQND